ncbi:hypothetical protein CEP53_006839 [Fusarium sp. AF-6]|nr:hypothetical protein CEP53_006839 [Fusarium sp. AF-6]
MDQRSTRRVLNASVRACKRLSTSQVLPSVRACKSSSHPGGPHVQAWDGCGQREKGNGRLGDTSHAGSSPLPLPAAVPIPFGDDSVLRSRSSVIPTSTIIKNTFPTHHSIISQC